MQHMHLILSLVADLIIEAQVLLLQDVCDLNQVTGCILEQQFCCRLQVAHTACSAICMRDASYHSFS